MNATSKLVKAWESKNAKNAAKAGGISLMALSLAACGGSSTTTTTTPVVETPVVETPVAGSAFVLDTDTNNVIGTANNDTVTATNLTLGSSDVINDVSATDSDTMTITTTTDITATPVVLNIENINVDVTGVLSGGDTTFAMSVDNIRGATISLDVTEATSLVSTADINTANSGTITLSDDFTTLTLAGVNNSDLVVNTSTAATSVSIDGTTEDAVTINGGGDVTVAASTNDGLLTVDAAGDATITADTATSVVATAAAGKDVTITSADAATSLTVTAGDDITVTSADSVTSATLTAATGLITATNANALTAATSVSATAQEDSAITADVATAVTVTSTGAAAAEVDFTLQIATVDTLTLSGSSAINAIVDAADITTETVTSTNTAGARLTVVANADVDLTNVATGVTIQLGDDFSAHTIDVANTGAIVELDANTANTNTVTFKAETATSHATNSITVNTADTVPTVADGDDTANAATLAFTDFGTVNIDATDDALSVSANITGDNLTSLVITGDSAVTIGNTVTGDATTNVVVDATGLAAAFGIDLDATANATETVKGGSKVDTITLDAAAASGNSFTIETNAGNDILDVNAAADFSFNGGDGNDRLQIADSVDLSANTIVLTSVETILLEADAEVTVDGSMVNGKTFLIDNADTDTNSTETITFTLDELTLDLSQLAFSTNVTGDTDDIFVVDGADNAMSYTITGSSYIDTITGGDNGDVISAGAGADTIDGDAGTDVITGGEGADTITGGAGADTIILTETTAAADHLIINAANEGTDTVTGFGTTDQILFLADDSSSSAGDDADIFNTGDLAIVLAATDAGTTSNAQVDLASTDYSEDALAVLDNHINVVTSSTGYASVSALLDAQTSAVADHSSLIAVFYNSTDKEVQLHYVSDVDDAADDYVGAVSTHLMTFSDIAATEIAAAFSADSFGTIAV